MLFISPAITTNLKTFCFGISACCSVDYRATRCRLPPQSSRSAPGSGPAPAVQRHRVLRALPRWRRGDAGGAEGRCSGAARGAKRPPALAHRGCPVRCTKLRAPCRGSGTAQDGDESPEHCSAPPACPREPRFELPRGQTPRCCPQPCPSSTKPRNTRRAASRNSSKQFASKAAPAR